MAEVFDFGLQQHKIKMDGKFFENNLFAVAGDTGRRLEVQLLNSNNMVQNTTGISLRLNADVAGQATYAEATLVDATKGLYELDLPNGMLIAPGNWQFQWQIIGTSGEKLHSFAFVGSIGSNLAEGAAEGFNFYLNLQDLKEMQEDFISGAFDSAALTANIGDKLNQLEESYAPRLLAAEQQLKNMIDIDPMEFGAKKSSEDINFDNTPILANIISYVNSRNGFCNVVFPAGEFRFNQGIVPPILANEVNFIGAGYDITRFILQDSTYFTFGSDSFKSTYGGIKDITLQHRLDNTNLNNPTVFAKNAANQIYRVKYSYGCTFLECGDSNNRADGQTIQNSSVMLANKGKPFVKLVKGAGFYWDTFDRISHVEALTPAWGEGAGYEMNTIPGTNAIDIVGEWDTVEIKIFAEKLWRGININNPSGVIYNVRDDSSVYDYIRDAAIHVSLETSGSVVSLNAINTYITTWEGHGIYLNSLNKDLRWINIINPNILYTGRAGVYIDGTGTSVKKFSVLGGEIRGSGRLDGSHAVVLGKYLKEFKIANSTIGGSDVSSNITWGDGKGIVTLLDLIDPLWEDYNITNNLFEFAMLDPDNSTSPIQANVRNGIIKGNSNPPYTGFKTRYPYTLPASNQTWVNVTPYEVEVFIGGSDVLDITKNGQLVPFTQGSFLVKPGESYKINYSNTVNLKVFYNVLN